MTLTDTPVGSQVFIDANIFIYHFAGRSEECSSFLARVEAGEIQGFTSQITLLEVAHRLMILEAIERGFHGGSNPSAQLARQPNLVQQLSKYYFSTLKIPQMGVEVVSLPEDFLMASQEYRQTYGLLMNDSLVLMHMRRRGLSLLASADAAFDAVPGIRRFSPSDV